MVLEQLRDGASRLLSALNLDEGTRKLVFLLCLPLVDGVFATLLVTGAVQTFSDVMSVSLTIFAGAGALAVLYSYSETRKDAARMVINASPFLLAGALAVSLIAPIFESLFYIQRVQYAAGLVLIVIAGKLLEVGIAEKVSTTTVLVTGLVVSVRDPTSLAFSFEYVLPALITAVTSLSALYAASFLTNRDMALGYVKQGAALVLLLIGVSMFGVDVPSQLGVGILGVSIAVSLAMPKN